MPSTIALGLLLLALLFFAIQKTETGGELLSSINFIQVKEASTARSLLAALLTGMISLSVFSFSMVMVVVNQSASNFSPKVIEGLINKNINQIILGTYIGTILFITVSLAQVGDPEDFSEVPHFNVFTSILLMTSCIGLFILFIQNISNSVRITNVAERIFLKTKESLQESSEGNASQEYPKGSEWYAYKSGRSGYFQSIASSRLLKLLKKDGIKLKVIPYYAAYLLTENDLFYLDRKIEDDELLNNIRETFTMYSGENIKENYYYGFRQLREVAVKGLSPGINDPGIAIICLDYLSELLSLYLRHEKNIMLEDEKTGAAIFFKRHSFAEIMNQSITPIKVYGTKDYLVLGQILKILHDIALYDKNLKHRKTLSAHARAVLDTARVQLDSSLEKDYVNKFVQEMKDSGYFKPEFDLIT